MAATRERLPAGREFHTVRNKGTTNIMQNLRRHCRILLAAALFGSSWSLAAQAQQSVEAFYKGNTINLYVGFSPGGSYDFYARLFARHMGRHIPGHPTIAVQTMPGAGSLR